MQTFSKLVVATAFGFSALTAQAQESVNGPTLGANTIPQVEETNDLLDTPSTIYNTSPATEVESTPGNFYGGDSPAVQAAPATVTNDAAIQDDVEGLDEADPNAEVEVVEERYDNGKVKIRREMTLDKAGNYIKHGQWTMFDELDQQAAFGAFANNKRDGEWSKQIIWGDSPVLSELPYTEFESPFTSKASFTNGKLNGTWSIVDAEGRVASEWAYTNGKLNGKAKWFFPDGSVREEIDYVDGLLDGEYRLLDAEGEELTKEEYRKGRKLANKQDLYANGVVRWEGIFLHETFVIAKPDNWWETQPVAYRKVGDSERHGKFASWYENGHKKFQGTFEHEVRIGEFSWWHENTQVAVKGSFKDGERDGVWMWWHENGQKAIQGNYTAGKLDGPWSYWDAGGKLERKIDYNDQDTPVAVHSVPSTDVRMMRPAAVAKRVVKPVSKLQTKTTAPAARMNWRRSAAKPVGTGVRVADRMIADPLSNPIRRY